MQQVNFGTLVFYENVDFQNIKKAYAFNVHSPILTEKTQIPPFQITRDTSTSTIQSARLISASGVETDILTDINFAGLEIIAKTGFDIIRYPSNVKLTTDLDQGAYYLELSDGTNTWFSEYFQMLESVENLLKIEFCHDGNFEHNDGYIDYSNGYKNRVYIDTELAKPEYKTEEKVTTRKGRKFPEYQTSWKLYKFNAFLPEYLCDVLRLVWQHDFVEIFQYGKKYEVSEFLMNAAEWTAKTDIAKVEFEFVTDRVYTTITGRGVVSGSCSIVAGSCFEYDFEAKSTIVLGGAEWTGNYYINSTGQNVALQTGDYIIEKISAVFRLSQFNGSGYDVITTLDGNVIWEQNNNQYYQNFSGTVSPNTFVREDTSVRGYAITGSTVEVWTRNAELVEKLIETGTSNEYLTGIAFTQPSGATQIQARIGSPNCGNYFIADWVDFGFPCSFTTQGVYTSIEAAIADGVQNDEYFILNYGNIYGLPAPIVIQVNPTVNYSTDAAAQTAIGQDRCYPVSQNNIYGLIKGTVKFIQGITTTYINDTEAIAAGFSEGQIYAWNAQSAGFGILLKQVDTDQTATHSGQN